MNAKRSWIYGDSMSAWLMNNRIVGLLIQKVRKIVDTICLCVEAFNLYYASAVTERTE